MISLPIDVAEIKGFLPPQEGEALFRLALDTAMLGPCLEIGSYCGKSTIYIGTACRRSGNILFALDHHRGSEEHQPGEEYHDPDLYDSEAEQMDSFKTFRKNLRKSGLEEHVVPIVSSSIVAAKRWATPLGMLFIDGGHSSEAALADYLSWTGHLVPGGILAIHDIFPDPADGGQAPFEIYKMAMASGLFEKRPMVGALGILRRL